MDKLLAGNALLREFDYDPLYRLLSATGRECKDIPKPRPWDDEPRCGFNQSNHGLPNQHNAPNLTALYRETYAYDAAGNMLTLQHQQAVQRNGSSGWETTWTRNFGMGKMTPKDWAQTWRQHLQENWHDPPPGNQLTHVEDRRAGVAPPPVVKQTHFFDANGNLTKEKQSRHFEWDHSDRMREFRTQAPNGSATLRAVYLYDSAGMRVKKLVVKPGNQSGGGQIETTVYVDEVFEHQQRVQAGATKENSWLHVMDGESRVALVRVGQPLDAKDVGPAVQYCLGDHLGSSNLVVDDSGNWVNREEFTPYGETSFGGFGKKRYRFTGKERDEESGLNYFGARYYSPKTCRWITLDPLFIDVFQEPKNHKSNTFNFLITININNQNFPRQKSLDTHDQRFINLYLYVYNSPENHSDILGLYPKSSESRTSKARETHGSANVSSTPADISTQIKAKHSNILFTHFEIPFEIRAENPNIPFTRFETPFIVDIREIVVDVRDIKIGHEVEKGDLKQTSGVEVKASTNTPILEGEVGCGTTFGGDAYVKTALNVKAGPVKASLWTKLENALVYIFEAIIGPPPGMTPGSAYKVYRSELARRRAGLPTILPEKKTLLMRRLNQAVEEQLAREKLAREK